VLRRAASVKSNRGVSFGQLARSDLDDQSDGCARARDRRQPRPASRAHGRWPASRRLRRVHGSGSSTRA